MNGNDVRERFIHLLLPYLRELNTNSNGIARAQEKILLQKGSYAFLIKACKYDRFTKAYNVEEAPGSIAILENGTILTGNRAMIISVSLNFPKKIHNLFGIFGAIEIGELQTIDLLIKIIDDANNMVLPEGQIDFWPLVRAFQRAVSYCEDPDD